YSGSQIPSTCCRPCFQTHHGKHSCKSKEGPSHSLARSIIITKSLESAADCKDAAGRWRHWPLRVQKCAQSICLAQGKISIQMVIQNLQSRSQRDVNSSKMYI
ncbi:hypothetical protein ACH5RR_033812, partial [Cinchona calisaya]